ncbi:hypothetical protein ACELLULO517_08570 [Acidisoma cellulosilytica]|uniref:Uncharacterized protein n=1 Tax=Acidisoma cellulosilyticum TaxID=2802395 RepID=A0A963Z1T7_9PROT|nr:hypothetical protein [Acidisoma cellulosilyticum]MCB8880283.1 hypothetical protein [Acidisoma cellulosilyticum]
MINTKLLSALTIFGGLAISTGAFAQSASQSSLVNGATTGLGAHHRFSTIAAAQDHCQGDTIVWSNGMSKTYKIVQSGAGSASHGFFACKMEADSAGFTQG